MVTMDCGAPVVVDKIDKTPGESCAAVNDFLFLVYYELAGIIDT